MALIGLGSLDLQLLAKGRLSGRVGGLPLERDQGLHWSTSVLPLQHRIHFLTAKCKAGGGFDRVANMANEWLSNRHSCS